MSAQLYPWPPRVVYSRSGLPVCTKCFNRDVLTESCTKKNQPRLTPQTRPFQIKRRLQRNADGTSALFKSPMNSCHRCVDCGHQSSKKKCHIYRHSFIDCLNVWQWFFMKQWNMTWISSCGMTEVALAKLPLCWCSTDSTGIFHETLPCFFLGAGCSASAKPLTSWSGVHCNMSESMHMRFLLTLDLFSTGNSHGAISIKPYKTLAQFCQFGVQHQGVLLHYHMIHMTCCKLKPGHLQSGSTQSIGSNSTCKVPRQSKFTIKHTCPRQPRCCLAGPSSLWTLSLHALFHWLVSSPEGWQFYAWVLHPCLRKPR